MKNLIYVLLFILVLSVLLCAQSENSLYIPRNVQKAYAAGTRSLDGKPGPNYFINSTDYKIQAELFPAESKLRGNAEIVFHNNSPDSLQMITLRLYPNLFAKGASRDFEMDPRALTEGMEILSLTLDGDTLITTGMIKDVTFNGTNMYVTSLPPVAPGASKKLTVAWEFSIPVYVPVRMGNYNDGEFMIAYWYPQVAVYDDIDHWDTKDYLGYVEFYNDFNNYEFEITVPDDFAVWATGELQNTADLFDSSIVEKIDAAKKSETPVKILSPDGYKTSIKKNGKNTWKFIAETVPDVSFAVSNSYVWDGAGVEVEPGRKVFVSVAYEKDTPNYENVINYSISAMSYLSHQLPGVPFPYPEYTTFCNKRDTGGMETPMMANNGEYASLPLLKRVTFHEMAHTYFPFMMGINERKYGWMDEGWASFFPIRFLSDDIDEWDDLENRTQIYLTPAGNDDDLPPIVPSYANKSAQLRNSEYNRPAVAYNELYYLLGEKKFKSALQEYINRWRGKHPIPYDFFFTFNEAAGEDLSWFWKPWFFNYGYPDLSIKSALRKDNTVSVTVKDNGTIPTRIEITLIAEDGTEIKHLESARAWRDNENERTFTYQVDRKINQIVLGSKYVADVDHSNNTFTFR